MTTNTTTTPVPTAESTVTPVAESTVTPVVEAAPAPTALSAANPTVSGTASSIAITVPNTSGTVTFQLIVTDNLGTESAPVTATVQIQPAPVAELTATPSIVAHGQTITLSGQGSSASSPGTIAKYTFTLENPPPTTTTG